jgi:hypothetical protein
VTYKTLQRAAHNFGASFASSLNWAGSDYVKSYLARRALCVGADGTDRRFAHRRRRSSGVALALVAANWFLLAAGSVVVGLLAVRTRTDEVHLVACVLARESNEPW